MKYIGLASSTLAALLVLGACGNSDKNKVTEEPAVTSGQQAETVPAENTGNSSGTENTTNDSDMKARMDKLEYKEFQLEVDYGQNKEYEAEIEQDLNEPMDAKVEDELTSRKLKGQEAFDDIYPKLEKLTIARDTPKEEVIQQVLDAFELKGDYVKFEVEITFNDGTKVEFEDKK